MSSKDFGRASFSISYDDAPSIAPRLAFVKMVTSRIPDLSLSDETHISTCHSIKKYHPATINNENTKENLFYFSPSDSECLRMTTSQIQIFPKV